MLKRRLRKRRSWCREALKSPHQRNPRSEGKKDDKKGYLSLKKVIATEENLERFL